MTFVLVDDIFRTFSHRPFACGFLRAPGMAHSCMLIVDEHTPNTGRVYHHQDVRIGYFAQKLDHLDLNKTILDSVMELPGMTQTYARTVLASFLFRDEDVFKPIGSLSMGERCRIAFVHLLVHRVFYFEGKKVHVFEGSFEAYCVKHLCETENSESANEIGRLELRLTQLISAETETEDERAGVMKEIRELRSQLDRLR